MILYRPPDAWTAQILPKVKSIFCSGIIIIGLCRLYAMKKISHNFRVVANSVHQGDKGSGAKISIGRTPILDRLRTAAHARFCHG
jgi:hypothetical protein